MKNSLVMSIVNQEQKVMDGQWKNLMIISATSFPQTQNPTREFSHPEDTKQSQKIQSK
jgi:hypothetical protein